MIAATAALAILGAVGTHKEPRTSFGAGLLDY